MSEKIMLFYIVVALIVFSYLLERGLSYFNSTYFSKPVPEPLADLYDDKEYRKSQSYKRANYRISVLSSTILTIITVLFLIFNGFNFIDNFARSYTNNPIILALIFFGILVLGSSLLSLPISYYKTFVIEEQFGFNKTTKSLFLSDFIKGLVLKFIFGGLILYILIILYGYFQDSFWLLAWGTIFIFMLIMNMFYTKLIVPLFNKQTPLQEGKLRNEIENYCKSVGFKLRNVFVIDGSKRSEKANAYFSGFGKTKQITLFDTLIKSLSTEEIVAVLAHEVGHYKHKHILVNLFLSAISTGVTLFLLSVCLEYPQVSHAIGVSTPSFHASLLGFSLLYSPISGLLSFLMNILSRKFEYQADNYTKNTYNSDHLITALFKLSKKSLSNLTPHPLYVAVYYSHPTLLQRLNNIRKT